MAIYSDPESRAMNGSVGLMLWILRRQEAQDLWTVGKALGVSPLKLQQYEYGSAPIPVAVLGRASAYFKTKLDVFFLPYHKPELFDFVGQKNG